jgi:ppGpp synthetase/RelA/SpoT-type nucleotidyltranferase
MSEDPPRNLIDWYQQKIGTYAELTTVAERTLKDLIRNSNIDHLSVTSRTKTLDSLIEKVKRKAYRNPQVENTDLAGVRVITYIESDVRKICDLIDSSFNVHRDKSVDKTDAMDVDRVGYRSVHFICDLGQARLNLQEWSHFENMLFEIQVRTVLQHAWAEIHYSRGYKFFGVLPRRVNRKIYCLAGTLEMVDMNFSTLAQELDNYAEEVTVRVSDGDLDIEVNSISLLKYLSLKLEPLKRKGVHILEDDNISKTIIEELENFGVSSLAKLDAILNEEFLESVVSHQGYTTYAGSLRDAMLVADIDLYFRVSWNNNWQEAESYTFEMLRDKYSEDKVESLFREKGIRWN